MSVNVFLVYIECITRIWNPQWQYPECVPSQSNIYYFSMQGMSKIETPCDMHTEAVVLPILGDTVLSQLKQASYLEDCFNKDEEL